MDQSTHLPKSAKAEGKEQATPKSAFAKAKESAGVKKVTFGKAPRKALKVFKAKKTLDGTKRPQKAQAGPKKAKVDAQKRVYKPGEIDGWLRPLLYKDTSDEGHDHDEWELEEFERLCLCKEPKDMGVCQCGCVVYMTMEEWHAKKEAGV